MQEARKLSESHSINWDILSKVVSDNQLAPVLYVVVRQTGIVDSSYEESLSFAYYYNAARNAVKLHTLGKVVHTLARRGIPVILLKGAALAERVYRNPALRHISDIDLLVPRDQLERSIELLSPLYQTPKRVGTYAGANVLLELKPEQPADRNGKLALDLNCYLVESPYYSHICFIDWLWRTASPAEIDGAAVNELCPEALVLHLCAHLLMDQKGKRLLWLHDIAEVLTLYREQLNWSSLLGNAQRFDLLLPLRYVLARLESDWHIVMPEQCKHSLNALQASPREQRFYASFASRAQPEPKLFALEGTEDRKALALGYLLDNLLPHPAYMSSRYQVGNRWLLPLSYPYRWYRGMRSALLESFPRRLRSNTALEQL